jgi:parallel beta-helix repeat protein
VAACSSSGDANLDVTLGTEAVTTTTSTVPESDCRAVAEHAIVLLQGFVDEYGTLSIDEWNALDPPPDLGNIRDQVVQLAQAAVDLGCDPVTMEAALLESIDDLSGEGPVGEALAAAFRGDDPILGPPAPVTTTTLARDTAPTTVTVEPGDDLDAVLDQVAPGSTVRFAAGTHEFTRPIVVDVDVAFVGAGSHDTVVSSTAEGFAVAFAGPGGFEVRDLTIEHTGTAPASVLLAIDGPVHLQGVVVRGGVAGPDEVGGGHGVVFAFEPVEGFPERSDAERAGELVVDDSVVTDNDAGGVLSTGDAAPTIRGATISANGRCGLCYVGTSAGTIENSIVHDNQIGVQITGEAAPTIVDSTVTASATAGISSEGRSTPSITNTVIDGNQIGVQVTGESAPLIRDNTIVNSSQAGVATFGTSEAEVLANVIEDNADVGVQIGESSNPLVEDNIVSGHRVGVAAAAMSTPSLSRNGITDHDIAVQIGGEARATIVDNTIGASTVSAISIVESSTAVVSDNAIADATGVGIQAAGSASVEIRGNSIETDGSIGISFVDDADGVAADNRLRNRSVGIRIGGSASPDVTDNTIRASVEAGIVFAEAATGRATGNDVSGEGAIGVFVSGAAAPELRDNSLTGNSVGLVLTDDARGTVAANTIQSNAVGVQMIGRSAASVNGNVIADNVDAGAVFGDASTVRFERNTVSLNGQVGLEISGSAEPTISENEVRGEGVYGVIYRDTGAGSAGGNRIVNYVYGIQLQGSAAPALTGNTLDEIVLTSIVYIDSSGGSASGNQCAQSLGGGISVTAPANPTLTDNACTLVGDIGG